MRFLWLILDHLCTFTAFPEIDHTIAEGGRFATGRGTGRDGDKGMEMLSLGSLVTIVLFRTVSEISAISVENRQFSPPPVY